MKRQITTTRDNSKTIFVPELDEHYHSIHGALQESMHVFIRSGLDEFRDVEPIHILEVGFGTGLNAWLSLQEAIGKHLHLNYTALEKYPVTPEEAKALEYEKLLPDGPIDYFQNLHEAKWEQMVTVYKQDYASFNLEKRKVDLKQFINPEQFNLIYFDAFAPSAQPDLWTEDIFSRMYNSLKTGGLLVTYCVKGDVRRAMKAAGFSVEKIPGPPGKREMARAWKK